MGGDGEEGEAILWVGGECNVKITVIKMLHVRVEAISSDATEKTKRSNTSYRPLAPMVTPMD